MTLSSARPGFSWKRYRLREAGRLSFWLLRHRERILYPWRRGEGKGARYRFRRRRKDTRAGKDPHMQPVSELKPETSRTIPNPRRNPSRSSKHWTVRFRELSKVESKSFKGTCRHLNIISRNAQNIFYKIN